MADAFVTNQRNQYFHAQFCLSLMMLSVLVVMTNACSDKRRLKESSPLNSPISPHLCLSLCSNKIKNFVPVIKKLLT